MRCKILFAAALAVAASSGVAMGEDLSDEEILQRFMIQREAFQAVKLGKGATRGLKIVSVDDLEKTPTGSEEVTETATATVEETTSGNETRKSGETVVVEAEPKPKAEEENVELAAAEVGVLPEELQVNVRISFDFDSALIPADQMPVIEQMCRVITASEIKLFRIMGHTDSSGSDAYNEELSRSRAEEVKRRLVTDCGVEPDRLDAMGLGERFLTNPADPKASENRRVEFQALS
jgi:outer membrane protein OmpA-like peptidoglycan-associated protein